MAQTQTDANKKWQEKNKEKAKYLSDRSRARSFIKKRIQKEDIDEFKKLILEKELEFNNLNIWYILYKNNYKRINCSYFFEKGNYD